MDKSRKKRSIEDYEFIQTKQNGKMQEEIGKGAFGSVRLAKEKATGQKYAIKTMNKRQLKEKSTAEYMKREIKIQKKLDHPHIVKLFHAFEDSENVYLILEYAPNGNLFFYLKRKKKLDEKESFVYFIQTALGIDYLHKKGIIHRDLKPENILIDAQGNVKICDFGWSAEIAPDRMTFCGTLDYMSPEMISNKPHDYRVDIWALGVLLYELLHGNAPFSGPRSNKEQTIKAIINSGNAELQFDASVSQDVRSLIKQILKVDPNQRITMDQLFEHKWVVQQAGELNIDLQAFIFQPGEQDSCISDMSSFTITMPEQKSFKPLYEPNMQVQIPPKPQQQQPQSKSPVRLTPEQQKQKDLLFGNSPALGNIQEQPSYQEKSTYEIKKSIVNGDVSPTQGRRKIFEDNGMSSSQQIINKYSISPNQQQQMFVSQYNKPNQMLESNDFDSYLQQEKQRQEQQKKQLEEQKKQEEKRRQEEQQREEQLKRQREQEEQKRKLEELRKKQEEDNKRLLEIQQREEQKIKEKLIREEQERQEKDRKRQEEEQRKIREFEENLKKQREIEQEKKMREFEEKQRQLRMQQEQSKQEQDRQEQMRQEQLRQEQLRQEKLRIEQQKKQEYEREQKKLEQQKAEQQRLEQLRMEQQQKIEQQRQEQLRQEQIRQEQQRQEQLKYEQSRIEQSRLDQSIQSKSKLNQSQMEKSQRLKQIEDRAREREEEEKLKKIEQEMKLQYQQQQNMGKSQKQLEYEKMKQQLQMENQILQQQIQQKSMEKSQKIKRQLKDDDLFEDDQKNSYLPQQVKRDKSVDYEDVGQRIQNKLVLDLQFDIPSQPLKADQSIQKLESSNHSKLDWDVSIIEDRSKSQRPEQNHYPENVERISKSPNVRQTRFTNNRPTQMENRMTYLNDIFDEYIEDQDMENDEQIKLLNQINPKKGNQETKPKRPKKVQQEKQDAKYSFGEKKDNNKYQQEEDPETIEDLENDSKLYSKAQKNNQSIDKSLDQSRIKKLDKNQLKQNSSYNSYQQQVKNNNSSFNSVNKSKDSKLGHSKNIKSTNNLKPQQIEESYNEEDIENLKRSKSSEQENTQDYKNPYAQENYTRKTRVSERNNRMREMPQRNMQDMDFFDRLKFAFGCLSRRQ